MVRLETKCKKADHQGGTSDLNHLIKASPNPTDKSKMKAACDSSRVRFAGWANCPTHWETWIQTLSSAHQCTWKNAGIYDAIMATKFPIKRHNELILELASRWCSQTNTFIFPWGEATLTMEDMMILGGFSASGISVLTPLEDDKASRKITASMELARKEIQRGKCNKAAQGPWMKKFMGTESDIEHEAFLALWLSRFVFIESPSRIINKRVFPIEVQLSRGVKFALARPVLGMLYKELTALKKKLMDTKSVDQLDLYGLFHLVQVWAWERFPSLRPNPNHMYSIEEYPRLARWCKVKLIKSPELRSAIDSAEDSFVWCPFAELDNHGDLQSFAQYVTRTKLAGFDCTEEYLPQRVARQFGLVQGIPTDDGDEMHDQHVCEDVKPFAKIKPTVTAAYKQWWKQKYCPLGSASKVKVEEGLVLGPPPGFPPQIGFVTIDDSESDDIFSDEEHELPRSDPVFKNGSKNNPALSSASDNDEILQGDQCLNEGKLEKSEKLLVGTSGMKREVYHNQESVPCGFTSKVVDVYDEPVDGFIGSDPRNGNGSDQNQVDAMEDADMTTGFAEAASSVPYNGCGMKYGDEMYADERLEDSGFDLEARISRLEKVVASIKKFRADGTGD